MTQKKNFSKLKKNSLNLMIVSIHPTGIMLSEVAVATSIDVIHQKLLKKLSMVDGINQQKN